MYSGKSLSESYQIREISKIVEVLGPLILAYLSALVFCSTCLIVLCYQVYFNDVSVKSSLYLAIANVSFWGFCENYKCFACFELVIFPGGFKIDVI
jgi:hypothetical protein